MGLTYAEKLGQLRKAMAERSLNAYIVASTDEFLNEYVDKDRSERIYLSGFDGSIGDILVTAEKAFLIVDGRYHIQAENQTEQALYTIEKVGVDDQGKRTEENSIERLVKVLTALSQAAPMTVGFNPNKTSQRLLDYTAGKLKDAGAKATLKPVENGLVGTFWHDKPPVKKADVRYIYEDISGFSPSKKKTIVQQKLQEAGLNAIFTSKLDDVAWLTNLRGSEIAYSSTFRGIIFMSPGKSFLYTDQESLLTGNVPQVKDVYDVLPLSDLEKSVFKVAKSDNTLKIAFDATSINHSHYRLLKSLEMEGCKTEHLNNFPIRELRTVKNPAELAYIEECFSKSDRAFDDLTNWVHDSVNTGQILSEKDVKEKIIERFKHYGAIDLSFEVISAVNKNGAIIHYTASSEEEKIRKGDLVLLDSGAYFAGGYATDLTRTFIAGGIEASPSERMRHIYTVVLKGALQGLMAELPPGTNGAYIDQIVRTPIKELGYDYNHGTGHGVGLMVHEAPPSINASGVVAQLPLKESMVFTIEPGVYIEGWGGVRIENVVTLVKHPDEEKAKEGWLKVESLTYAPLDEALIDKTMLTREESEYLETFQRKFRQ